MPERKLETMSASIASVSTGFFVVFCFTSDPILQFLFLSVEVLKNPTFNVSTRGVVYVIQLVHDMLVLAVEISPCRIFRRSEVEKDSGKIVVNIIRGNTQHTRTR